MSHLSHFLLGKNVEEEKKGEKKRKKRKKKERRRRPNKGMFLS